MVAQPLRAGSFSMRGARRLSTPKNRNWICGKRSRAMAAPLTTASGALSPPIASSATTRGSLTRWAPYPLQSGRLGGDRQDLALAIMTTGLADMVRALHFPTIRAFDVAGCRQMMVRAPHIAAGFRRFLLRHSHDDVPLGPRARRGRAEVLL